MTSNKRDSRVDLPQQIWAKRLQTRENSLAEIVRKQKKDTPSKSHETSNLEQSVKSCVNTTTGKERDIMAMVDIRILRWISAVEIQSMKIMKERNKRLGMNLGLTGRDSVAVKKFAKELKNGNLKDEGEPYNSLNEGSNTSHNSTWDSTKGKIYDSIKKTFVQGGGVSSSKGRKSSYEGSLNKTNSTIDTDTKRRKSIESLSVSLNVAFKPPSDSEGNVGLKAENAKDSASTNSSISNKEKEKRVGSKETIDHHHDDLDHLHSLKHPKRQGSQHQSNTPHTSRLINNCINIANHMYHEVIHDMIEIQSQSKSEYSDKELKDNNNNRDLISVLNQPHVEEIFDDVPTFGTEGNVLALHNHPLNHEGRMAAKRILCALNHMCPIDYCPMLTDLIPLMLYEMPESLVYVTVHSMWECRPFYFPTSYRYWKACYATIRYLIIKQFPQTSVKILSLRQDGTRNTSSFSMSPSSDNENRQNGTEYMQLKKTNSAHRFDYHKSEMAGGIGDEYFENMFHEFFIPYLQYKDALRIVDLYIREGMHALFRVTLALIKYLKGRMKISDTLTTGQLWWRQFTDYSFNPDFDIEEVVRIAREDFGGRVIRGDYLDSKIEYFLSTLDRNLVEPDIDDTQPMTVLPFDKSSQERDSMYLGMKLKVRASINLDVKQFKPQESVLLYRRIHRKLIAKWIPKKHMFDKLRLIYSSYHHGRSLQTMYNHIKEYSNKSILKENKSAYLIVIKERKHDIICGAYVSSKLEKNASNMSGTGETSVFRLSTPPCNYVAKSDIPLSTHIFCTDEFFSLIGRGDEYPALKVDKEFERGQSHASPIFHNTPLCGRDSKYFNISEIELFDFVKK